MRCGVLLLLLLLLLLTLVGVSHAAFVCPVPSPIPPTLESVAGGYGEATRIIATDMNADGITDAVISQWRTVPFSFTTEVTTLDGVRSRSSIATPVPVPGPGTPYAYDVSVGDFDGDSFMDVVGVRYYNDRDAYFGKGDGSGAITNAGVFAYWIGNIVRHAVDINSDGKSDLVFAGYPGSPFYTTPAADKNALFWMSGGDWTRYRITAAAVDHPAVLAGLYDADDLVDVIYTYDLVSFTFIKGPPSHDYLNDGVTTSFTFAPGTVRHMMDADVNVDNATDLVFSLIDGLDYFIAVCLGPNPHLAPRTMIPLQSEATGWMIVSDLESDGIPEIVVLIPNALAIYSLVTLDPLVYDVAGRSVFPLPAGVAGTAAVDGDANGFADIGFLIQSHTNYRHTLYTFPVGPFDGAPGTALNASTTASSMATADLDGNGVLDLVYADGSTGSIVILYQGLSSGFESPRELGGLSLDGTPCVFETLAVYDVDGDGSLDLVGLAPTSHPHRVVWLRNSPSTDGRAYDPPALLCSTSGVLSLPPSRLSAVNINGDDLVDLFLVSPSGSIASFINGGGSGVSVVSDGTHADAVLASPQAPLYEQAWPPVSGLVYAVPSTGTVYAGTIVLGSHSSLNGVTALGLATMDHLPGHDLVWASPGLSGVGWASSSQNPDPSLLFDLSSHSTIDVGTDVLEFTVVISTFDGMASLVCLSTSRDAVLWATPVLALGVRANDHVLTVVAPGDGMTGLSNLVLTDATHTGTASIVVSSTSHGIVVVKQLWRMGSTQSLARLLSLDAPECGGVPNSFVCVAAALARTSPCVRFMPELVLPPAPVTRCRVSGPPVPVHGRVRIKGSAHLAGPSVVDCGSRGGGSLFSVASGGDVVLENIVFQGASSVDVVSPVSPLSIQASGSLTLHNVAFSGFTTGSGTVQSSTVGRGGVMQVEANSKLTGTLVSFTGNTAYNSGGAIAVVGSSAVVSLESTSFTGNVARGLIGGSNSGGGSIAILSPSTTLTLTNCSFVGSTAAAGLGGAIFAQSSASTLTLTDVSVRSSSAGVAGGALAVVSMSGSVVNWVGTSVVSGCSAGWGGVFSLSATVLFPASPVGSLLGIGSGGIGTVLSLGAGVAVSGGSASYGGFGFVCDASVSLPLANNVSGTFSATYAGSRFFLCSSSDPAWTQGVGPFGPGTNLVAGAYGSPDATSPSTLSFVTPFPNVVASGFDMQAVVAVTDDFGTQVTDPTMVFSISALNVAELAVVPPSSTLDADGNFAVTVSAAVRNWPDDLNRDMTFELSAGAQAVASVTRPFTACPPGLGRSSTLTEPLVCSLCQGIAFSLNMSTAPCDAPISCGGTALLIDNECVECPPLSVAAPNATASAELGILDCTCIAGAWAPPWASSSAPCTGCPQGGFCPGGDALPTALPDYYPLSTVGTFTKCPIEGSCNGGTTCSTGYAESFACRNCASGYHRVGDGSCEECPGMAQVYLVLFGVLFVAVAAASFVVSYIAVHQALNSAATAHSSSTTIPYSLTVFLLWMQTVALLYSDSFSWPSSVRDTLRAFSFTNIDISFFYVECNELDYSSMFVIKMLLPVVFSVAVVANAFLYMAYRRARGKVTDTIVPIRLPTVLVRVSLSLMPIAYIPLSKASLQFFDCTKLANGKWYNDAALDVECGGSMWMDLLPLALASVALYVVGLPLSIGVAVYRIRHKLDDTLTRAKFGPVISSYKPQYYFFEVFQMAWKRLSVVVVVLFASTSPAWLFVGLIVSFLVTLQIVTRIRPFKRERHTVLDIRLSFSLLVLTILGVFFWAGHFGSTTHTILVVATLGLLGVSVILLGGAVLNDAVFSRAHRVEADPIVTSISLVEQSSDKDNYSMESESLLTPSSSLSA